MCWLLVGVCFIFDLDSCLSKESLIGHSTASSSISFLTFKICFYNMFSLK